MSRRARPKTIVGRNTTQDDDSPKTNLVTNYIQSQDPDILKLDYRHDLTCDLYLSSDVYGWLRTADQTTTSSLPLTRYQVSMREIESCRHSLESLINGYLDSKKQLVAHYEAHKDQYTRAPFRRKFAPSFDSSAQAVTLFQEKLQSLPLAFEENERSELYSSLTHARVASPDDSWVHSEAMINVIVKVNQAFADANFDMALVRCKTIESVVESEAMRLGVKDDYRLISIPPVRDGSSPPTWRQAVRSELPE